MYKETIPTLGWSRQSPSNRLSELNAAKVKNILQKMCLGSILLQCFILFHPSNVLTPKWKLINSYTTYNFPICLLVHQFHTLHFHTLLQITFIKETLLIEKCMKFVEHEHTASKVHP